MRAVRNPALSEQQQDDLDQLYRTSKDPRVRTRAHMVFLSAEQGLTAPEIAPIVRESEDTVERWLKRYLAEGAEGLKDAPRPGRPVKIDETFRTELQAAVRRRPRSLDLPFSMWTLQRLVDYMAEKTGKRVSVETVRTALKKVDIVLSRPQHTISSPDPEYGVKKRRSRRSVTT